MNRSALAIVAAAAILASALPATADGTNSPDCVGLSWPVPGAVIAPFQPRGAYAGHWGIDVGTTPGTPVLAADGGYVTYAGTVAGNNTVTVHHGGELKTSYSYLDAITVAAGRWVAAGTQVGWTATAHDTDSVHLSVRLDGRYVDPLDWFGCHVYDLGGALRLVR